MSYQVLARKWRPKSFETLVGQEHVVRALSNALEQQRLHHAYLFTGTRGVGKTTLARILAKSLNCETGITAKPCGICRTCQEIDQGRYIDLIEVDAASNTQVDNMRDLLENAQYAPSTGRFKVYIIDEVHMLTRQSFNAMLKTLEEPPAHVKFILATTDPQKLPVTILSRCLQFNLRQMPSHHISQHLQTVLTAENIPFELPAIQQLSRAAAGSMRDALSLLDQAIAYGGQAVNTAEVRAMLGSVDQSYLYQLLEAVSLRDGKTVLEQTRAMEARSLSFDTALAEIAQLLQQIAVLQTVPEAVAEDLPEKARLTALAAQLSGEEVQLFYQIAVLGRRDLALAPDEFAGFSMTLLRMLAFRPVASSTSGQALGSAGTSRPALKTSITNASPSLNNITISQTIEASPLLDRTHPNAADKSMSSFDGDWRQLVDQLKSGLGKTLAGHCELIQYADHRIRLRIPAEHKHLLAANYVDKLTQALAMHFGTAYALDFEVGDTPNAPLMQKQQEKQQLHQIAVQAIEQDPFVQALVRDFDATIVPASIKPIQ